MLVNRRRGAAFNDVPLQSRLRTPPEGLSESRLVAALADGWEIVLSRVEYRPVGGGSYHWLVSDGAGTRYFVTADDLDQKGYLGADRDSAFEGLRCALDTAHALRHHIDDTPQT